MSNEIMVSLGTLAEIDDAMGQRVKFELEKLLRDLVARPALSKPRKLTIQIELVPQADDLGEFESALLTTQCKPTIPNYGGRTRHLVKRGNTLVYRQEHEEENERAV